MWGSILGAVAPAALGALGSMFGGKQEGGGGITPMQWNQNPQYDFTEPRLRQTSDFLSQQMDALGRGEMPAWYQNAMPQLRQGMMRGAGEWLYGGPMSGPGAMSEARAGGAAMGLGPRATMAQSNKAMDKYGSMTSAIDEYLTGRGVDIAQQGSTAFPQLMMGMPQGPQGSWSGGVPYSMPTRPNYMGDAIGKFAGNMDWGSLGGMFGGIGSGGGVGTGQMYAPGKQATTYTSNTTPTWLSRGYQAPQYANVSGQQVRRAPDNYYLQ
jgi:hypothetical protein